MPEKTIFERIISREIPAKIVFEDDHCLAFHDAHPQAPVHVLLIPRKPIPSLEDVVSDDAEVLGHLLSVVPQLTKMLSLTGGYRVVINCGQNGGQTVDHLHLHVLGGRPLSWPPG
ncbi:MAG: histidine triad nucleotide-binding protein [Planctomycetota bacterium]|nr:histidine triad nucleotide-binding protein [Planctomycetota bacterium]MDA1178371.1 histidine triad nucleotide-binding protein [Planctomycetota bacterium]